PATGGTVRLDDMTKSYWASRYMGARRVVAVSNLPDLPTTPVAAAPSVAAVPTLPAAPARPSDDDPLGTLVRARSTLPADDDPIAQFGTR
ncbi:peptidase P60, partial [Ralstonia solanacearum]